VRKFLKKKIFKEKEKRKQVEGREKIKLRK
jgi:hypothetical protein